MTLELVEVGLAAESTCVLNVDGLEVSLISK